MILQVSPKLSCPSLFPFFFLHQTPPISSSLKTRSRYTRTSYLCATLATIHSTNHYPEAVEEHEHNIDDDDDVQQQEVETEQPFSNADVSAEKDARHLKSPELDVKELEELPEQWRRSKIAWLCKELPAHKPATMLRVLSAQRKWVRQDDATYVALHCMRIRENEAGYRVYKWMSQQRWYHFDFALVTKLADYLGKDRKFSKCRELFDAIITQGQVPSESTFHILIVAYLSAPVDGSLEEACSIYNKMIQLGGYLPRLSLHNSLFRALVSRTGGASKNNIKQAEYIYHNLLTTNLEIHKDIYAGLIWLHSYQDVIDKERIATLRQEMKSAGFEESRDVLLSILRASSKEGHVEETERIWLNLLESGYNLPSQAFVYRMELYAKTGQPMKTLEIFNAMKGHMQVTVAAYYKIIEVMSKAHEIDIAEELMDDFIKSGMKPLIPAFLDLIYMYSDLEKHDKVETTFSKCIMRCHPNRILYSIYLQSLVRTGNLERAQEIFDEMFCNGTIGATARSCNTILGGYLNSGEYGKAEKIYDIMRQKKYEVEPQFTEKLHYVFSLKRKVVKRRVSMKLDQEQREILIGLLLGGVRIESDEDRKNHSVHFEFTESSDTHSSLKMHIHERFYEWLPSSSRLIDAEVPCQFSTIPHSYFGFFADQFWMKGKLMIPKLIHRWLSPRVLSYWFMYGGFRISSGDILLKLKVGNREDVEKVVKALQAKSLACKVKRKGRVYWIGMQGDSTALFWDLTEPYLLENIRDQLKPCGDDTRGRDEREEIQANDFASNEQ